LNSLLSPLASRLAAISFPRKSNHFLESLRRAYAAYSSECKFLVPPVLVSALLAAEDHRFYAHVGFDHLAIMRALWHSIYHRRLTGGSTIEQQLVRTLTGRRERSLRRKIGEVALSLCVSQCVPKRDVPGLYLSVAYFGWRMNGLRQVYTRLGISGPSLTLRQAAEIVARLKYPEPSSPNSVRAHQIEARAAYIVARLSSSCPELSSRPLMLKDYEAVSPD